MGESNVEAASVISDIVRTIFSFLDRPAYWLLGIMYQLFFNVASADLFSNDTIMKFYGRVQLILGVFMMFKLALIILKGIVEPEGFFGGKKGDSSAGSFITKVITGLIILTLMMPISIPGASNEYEIQINNNGILFGTLYSLQHRLLANNTLARFVLGNDDMAEDYGNDTDKLKKSARIFTSSILKGFYRINLLPEDERPKHEDGKDDAVFNDNRVCKDIDDDVLKAYTRLDADPGDIISMVNLTCEGNSQSGGALNSVLGTISPKLAGKTYYVFSYMPFISMVVPLVFVFILLSFTIDVAVRAVKLAVLRLIAPIPIISYMDPKGSKDSAFNSWVKTLTSTYLDLFIRLAAVYFAIFLIQDMITNGVVINHGHGVIGAISLILIWIGIFVFAKQAPKFIKDVLGLKGDSGKLFGGLGDALAVGAMGAGVVGGAVSRGAAAFSNNNNNKGKALAAALGGGILGAVGGGVNAGKNFFNAKSDAKSIMSANRAYNDRNYAYAADDSTFLGRTKAGVQGTFGMRTDLQNYDKKIAAYQRAEAGWKSIQNALNSDGWTGENINDHRSRGGFVSGNAFVTSNGEEILTANTAYSTKDLKDTLDRMKASGRYTNAELSIMEGYVKSAEKSRFEYIRTHGDSLKNPRERQVYEGIQQINSTAQAYKNADDGVWKNFGTGLGDYKGAAYAAGAEATQFKNSDVYAQAKSNDQRAKDKK